MTQETEPQENRNRKRIRAFLIMAAIVALGLAGLHQYRSYARTHVKTDDAFVEGSVHLVAPRLAGTVMEVLVTDNQYVKAGAPLVRLDPEPLLKSLEEAEATFRSEESRLTEAGARLTAQEKQILATRATLARTRASIEELRASLSAREAEVQARSAALDQARLDLQRAEKLARQDVVPASRHDQARTAFEVASANLTAAREMRNQAALALESHKNTVAQVQAQVKAEEAALQSVRASLASQKEQIARRRAQAEMAGLSLSYATVTAPTDGYVTRKSVEVGNTVQAGQPLMSLVNLDDAFIVANYKETRIGLFNPGQKVSIRIDSYPGRRFQGTLDSIMVGTGAAFTLFPPENASGNYVKVVQRVPVKIVFDDLEEVRPLLRVGLSVVPTILTEK